MKIVIALLIFSFIIIFHELGHLLLAKKNGIKVVEFSVGLGPTIIGKEFGGTKYSLKLLPFGGACQMLGEEDMDNTEAGEEGTYYSRSVWQRMTVILAGPFFNFILAFILALFVTGIVGYDPALVTGVTKDTPAYDAGLRAGDTIKKMNHSNISIGREIDSFFLYNGVSTKPIEVIYERDGEKYETTLYPEKIKKYLLGFTYNLTDSSVAVEELEKGYPMEEAGVEKGDIILEINGHKILSGKELNQFFSAYPLDGSEVQMLLERNGSEFTVSITPRFISETYSVGFNYNLYRDKANAGQVIKYSFVEVKYWIVSTVRNLGMLVTGRLSKDDVGGAVAIVDMIGDSYEETKATGSTLDVVLQLMYITILLSANLGVMNLLPIPALDGGKFLFLIAEAVAGKPLNRKVEGIVNLAGFVLLMLLMVFVFFNDIMRLIGR
ncbi:MAG: RIP metalloprotease RseP [Lachnospiraceae bacterium]|nr:RIP metalloprotease RseP [Lachnospiraceae bacterium]